MIIHASIAWYTAILRVCTDPNLVYSDVYGSELHCSLHATHSWMSHFYSLWLGWKGILPVGRKIVVFPGSKTITGFAGNETKKQIPEHRSVFRGTELRSHVHLYTRTHHGHHERILFWCLYPVAPKHILSQKLPLLMSLCRNWMLIQIVSENLDVKLLTDSR